MSPSLLNLCVAELRKIRGRGLAAAVMLFGALHGALAVGVLLALVWFNGRAGGSSQDFFSAMPALRLAVGLTQMPLNTLALLFLGSLLWAEDYSLGTLAMVFVRPVRRAKVFTAKLIVAWGVGLSTFLAATLTAAVLGVICFGFGADVPPDQAPQMVQPLLSTDSTATQLRDVALEIGRGTLLLGPALALVALMATVTRSPVMTLFGTLFIVATDFVGSLVLFAWGGLRMAGSEFATELGSWTLTQASFAFLRNPIVQKLPDGVPLPDGKQLVLPAYDWQPLAALAVYLLLFYGGALLLFVRRDVT